MGISSLDLSSPTGMAAALAPELFLTGAVLVLLLFVAWRHSTAADVRWTGWLTVASLVIGLALLVGMHGTTGDPGMIALDTYRWAGGILIFVAALAATL
ncbi:MAG TPA: hypothetical protein VFI13_00950, partial [Gemmatimonadales bacterium]|nr:hypothetical protein [Gemmatimonadales bacterium]